MPSDASQTVAWFLLSIRRPEFVNQEFTWIYAVVVMDTQGKPVSSIAREILNYLVENREAKDNLEGITHWWLLKQSVRRSISDVRVVLGELLDMGYLIRQGKDPELGDDICPFYGDENVHYQINLTKLREIQALLEQNDRTSPMARFNGEI